MEFQPGEKFAYSNSGYVLLGKLIETCSGTTYEEYLHRHVFEPLNMRHSGYDHGETIIKRRASGYNRREDGTFMNAEYIDMSVAFASGGLYSTVEDLYIFDQALYSERLLTKVSLEKMFEPYSEEGFGYGWIIPPQQRKVIGQSGAIPGFASMIHRYVDDHASIIVLSNILSDVATMLSFQISELIFR